MSSNVFNQKLTFHLLVQIDLSGIQNLEYTVYNIFWEGGGELFIRIPTHLYIDFELKIYQGKENSLFGNTFRYCF